VFIADYESRGVSFDYRLDNVRLRASAGTYVMEGSDIVTALEGGEVGVSLGEAEDEGPVGKTGGVVEYRGTGFRFGEVFGLLLVGPGC